MACLAPWAFGSVEAWAQLLLAFGLVILTVLRLFMGWIAPGSQRNQVLSVPSLAVAALLVLTLVQSSPLPTRFISWIAPQAERSRSQFVPDHPQGLIEGAARAVEPPESTASLEPGSTRRAATQIAAVWILFLCSVGLGSTIRGLRRFGLFIAVNATLLGLFSLIQALTWDGRIYGLRPSPVGNRWYTGGPFVCHNHLAAYLNLGLGLGLGALMASLQSGSAGTHAGIERAGDRGRFLWLAYAVALIFVGLIATHSRGGFLAMLAAAGVTFLVLRPRVVNLHLGLLAVVLIVPIFLFAIGTDSPYQRLATISEASETGFNGRTALWSAAVRTWAERPIFGAGLGTFEVAVAPVLERDLGVRFQHAENEYLELAAEGGLAGLLIFLSLLGSIGFRGYRALSTAVSSQDRAWILGALFVMIALAVQSMGDFPLHIPGITVPLVILAAILFGLGKLPCGKQELVPVPAAWGFQATAANLLLCGLAVTIAVHQYKDARAEASRAGAGFPMAGAAVPDLVSGPRDRQELELAKSRLSQAIAFQPDSYENHLQLGMVEMKLYSLAAEELLLPLDSDSTSPEEDAEDRPLKADPLWLLGSVHAATAEDLAATGGLLAHAPIRDHLVPAARCFLEARRCSPFRALVHAQLASLDYLLDSGEDARVHLERALRLAGPDSQVLALVSVAAVQVGALDLAAESWRKTLLAGRGDWREIADMANQVLSPEEILEQVVPPGRSYEIWFADLLYAAPEDQEIRSRFLRASLERVPRNADLSSAERTWLQGQACARLDEREQARRHMQRALSIEPRRSPWRLEYVTWLLSWGQVKEAHTQARIGVELDPYYGGLKTALSRTVEALARASPTSSADRQVDVAAKGDRAAITTQLGARP